MPFFFREWLRKNILRGDVPDPPPMVQEGVGLHYTRLKRLTRAGRTPSRKTGGEKNTLTGNCEGRVSLLGMVVVREFRNGDNSLARLPQFNR